MATSTEDAVSPTNTEEQSKDTPEADKTVVDEQKADTIPANTSEQPEQVADDAVKSKDEASALERPESHRSPSPIPDLGTIWPVLCVVHDPSIIVLATECRSDPICCQTVVI